MIARNVHKIHASDFEGLLQLYFTKALLHMLSDSYNMHI
jgi:hypothetical protein